MIINKQTTVAEVVAKRLGADKIFSKYQIDFCCGGGLSLEAACTMQQVDMNVVIEEIEAVNATIASEEKVSKEMLVRVIHEISPLAQKVASVHGFGHPEMIGISDSVEQLITDYVKDVINDKKVDELTAKIRVYANNFVLPADACTSYSNLFLMLQQFEADWKTYKKQ